MTPGMFTVRVLKIEPDTLYMGVPYGAWVTVELQDGTRLELFYDHADGPLSLLWKRAAIEISGGIGETVERIPELVQQALFETRGSSSLEARGAIVRTWTKVYSTREYRYGLVDFGIGAITVELPKDNPEDFREGNYVHVRTPRTDLDRIHELVEYEPEIALPYVGISDASKKEDTKPFIIEFFVDENLSVQRYRTDPPTRGSWWDQLWRDVESAPWHAWLGQQASLSLKIGDNYIFREGTDASIPHFIESSPFSLLGVFVQSGIELLRGETVAVWPCSSSAPHLILEPCGRDLVRISVLESDTLIIPATVVSAEDYMKAVIDAVDRYLWQVLEIHPHMSKIPYPRLLADRRNELMMCCCRRGILPGDGHPLDYDALADRVWYTYRQFLPPTPEGEVSNISFDATLIEGKTPENPLFRFSLLVDGQVLFDDVVCDKLIWATQFIWGRLSSIDDCLEGKTHTIELTSPGPRTITLIPNGGVTILFSLDNIYEQGVDARNIVLRIEDWIEVTLAMAEKYVTLVSVSPLWVEESFIGYLLLPRIEAVREKYRIYLKERGESRV